MVSLVGKFPCLLNLHLLIWRGLPFSSMVMVRVQIIPGKFPRRLKLNGSLHAPSLGANPHISHPAHRSPILPYRSPHQINKSQSHSPCFALASLRWNLSPSPQGILLLFIVWIINLIPYFTASHVSFMPTSVSFPGRIFRASSRRYYITKNKIKTEARCKVKGKLGILFLWRWEDRTCFYAEWKNSIGIIDWWSSRKRK